MKGRFSIPLSIPFVVAICLATLFAGCAPSVESQLVGKWKPEAAMPAFADVQLDMKADRRFELKLQSLIVSQTISGDWEYLRPEGEAHLISLRIDGAEQFQEKSFTMPTTDSLIIGLDPIGAVRLVRVVEGR